MIRPRTLATTALVFAGVAAGAIAALSVDGAAQEAPSPAQAQEPAKPVPEPAKPDETPVKPEEPQGKRPIDEGAIRALAEEVARLRAELAQMRAEGDAAAKPETPDEDAPPDGPFITPGPAGASGPPGGAQEPPVGVPPPGPGPEDPVAQGPGPDEPPPERIVERVVERTVEREVPVYIETDPIVVYEQVIYRDVSCWQTIPHGHVHSIGCGHHYYGCACHSWYYDLVGGLDIRFVHIDRDHDHRRGGDHHRGRDSFGGGKGPHSDRYGNRDGGRVGFRDGGRDDRDGPRGGARPESARERSPAAPGRDSARGRDDRPGSVAVRPDVPSRPATGDRRPGVSIPPRSPESVTPRPPAGPTGRTGDSADRTPSTPRPGAGVRVNGVDVGRDPGARTRKPFLPSAPNADQARPANRDRRPEAGPGPGGARTDPGRPFADRVRIDGGRVAPTRTPPTDRTGDRAGRRPEQGQARPPVVRPQPAPRANPSPRRSPPQQQRSRQRPKYGQD